MTTLPIVATAAPNLQKSSETPADAALARLAYELAHPPFHAVLAPQAVSADPSGEVLILLPYQKQFRRAQDSGDIHGGVIASIIDIAAHAAVAVQIERMAPTIDLRIDYLRAARAGDLHISAKTLRVGRAVARVDVEVRGADDIVVAVGRGTFSTAVNDIGSK